MRDLPTLDDLLLTAQKVTRERLVPNLPEAERYAGLMVASAMAIAARAVAKSGETAARDQAERDDLAAILRAGDATNADLRRCLCRAIRGGDFDPGRPDRERAFALLQAGTRAEVEICNPAYLGSGPGR
jgi:hypothetical protein